MYQEIQKEFFPDENSFSWAFTAESETERRAREAMILLNMTAEQTIGKKILGIEEPDEQFAIVNPDVTAQEMNHLQGVLLGACKEKGNKEPLFYTALSVYQELLRNRL